MLRRMLILFLACVMVGQGSFLYGSPTLSLDFLIQEARENNPEILAAKKRWEASLARVPQEKSLENPSVGLTFEKIPNGTLKFDQTMPEDRMLTVSQFLPLFGKLSLKGKIAVIESQMAAAEYKNMEWDVIKELKNAYYKLFLTHKEIELRQASFEVWRAVTKILETRYAVGKASQQDVLKAHVETATLGNTIENLKQEKRVQETMINTLLNAAPESVLGVPHLSDDLSMDKDLAVLYDEALGHQPELNMFSYAIEKNKYAKKLASRSFFPDLMASIVQRGITSGALGPWDLMLSFNAPLWFWTKQRYQVKEAIANLEEAEAAYQVMKNKVLLQTKDAYTKIHVAQNKIKLYKSNLAPLLESAFSSALASFRSGEDDLMMILDNERMLIENKMAYYQALVDHHMSLAELERIVGESQNR